MKGLFLRISLVFFVFGLFGFYFYKNLPEILTTFNTTSSNLSIYFFVAFIFVFAATYFNVQMFRETFKMNGLRWPVGEMFRLLLYSHAANIIIPTAGLSFALVYADRAREKKESPAAAISGIILAYLADYTAVSTLLLILLAYFYSISSLSAHVLIPALIFLAITFFLYFLAYKTAKGSKAPKRIILGVVKFVGRILKKFKKEINVERVARQFFKEFEAANKSIIKNPGKWFDAILLVLTAHFLRLISLYVIFNSLGVPPSFKILFSAYAVGVLFFVISPTPEGVGFVEGAMILTFTSFGIPSNVATTATLLYRALTFWIPFFIGFVMLQRSRIKRIFKEIDLEEDGTKA